MEKELIEQTIKYLQEAAATLSSPGVGVSPQTDTVNGVAAASEFRRTFPGMHGIRPGNCSFLCYIVVSCKMSIMFRLLKK